jgi:hypothetical protein
MEMIVHRNERHQLDPAEGRGTTQGRDDLRFDEAILEKEPLVVRPRHEMIICRSRVGSFDSFRPCHISSFVEPLFRLEHQDASIMAQMKKRYLKRTLR